MSYEVIPIAQVYYDRMDTELAVAIAREMIAEWSYTEDPDGYCHVRPMLVRLLETVAKSGGVTGG